MWRALAAWPTLENYETDGVLRGAVVFVSGG